MKTVKSLLLACCLACAAPAFAQEEASLEDRAVYRLLEAADMRASMEGVMTKMLDLQMQNFRRLPCGKNIEPEFRKFLAKYFSYDALKPYLSEAYKKHFSLEELNEIAAFYETPTGRKAVKKTPAMLDEGVMAAAAQMQKHQGELIDIVKTHVNEDGTCRNPKAR